MRVIQWNIVLCVLSFLIAACGGGGGDEKKDVNNPPQLILDGLSFAISENTYDITVLTAFDIDLGDEIQLSLLGQDASHIVFDDNTGQLAFIQPPSFDNPKDKNGDNIYEVTIRLTDKGGLTDEKSIKIHIQDHPGPEFHPPSVIQIPEHSSVVHRLGIGDDPSISVTIGGVDAKYFVYQAGTGLLSFIVAPDYESPFDDNRDNIYQITLQAHNINGESVVREVDIEVNDIDESQNQPPIIVVGSEISLDENRLGVVPAPIVVTDLEQDEFTLLLEGEDASFFFIDAEGQLVNHKAFDFESPEDADGNNRYELVVKAIDFHGLQSSAAFSVVVKDLDDSNPENQPPVLTMGRSFDFIENSSEHVLSFNVSDPEGDNIQLYFDGDDAAHFILGQSGRTVFFRTSPDFEAPTDLDKDNIYHLTINADDGKLIASQQVEVRVHDTDDELRLSIGSAYHSDDTGNFKYLRVPENTLEIGTLKVEGGPDTGVEFAVTGFYSERLRIDPDTFVLRYAEPQDAETDPEQIFADIVAYTADLRSSLLRLVITIKNVKEPPFFDIETGEIAMPENTLNVVSFNVNPDKSNADVVEINSSGDDAELFKVSSNTHFNGTRTVQISFIDEPNFEGPRDADANGVYSISIDVEDSEGLSASQSLAITVTDVAEQNSRPKLFLPEVIYVDPYTLDIPLIATATDKDNDTITFSLEGEHADYLKIDETTGELDFADDFSRDNLPSSVRTGFAFKVKVADYAEDGFDQAEVDLKFYTGELDILFPGREHALTEKDPSNTSLVLDDLSGIAQVIDVDGIPLNQSSDNIFHLDQVDYESVENSKDFNITDAEQQERGDLIIFGNDAVVSTIIDMNYADDQVVISDRLSNRLYATSHDALAQQWRALSCQYKGEGSISLFTESDKKNSFYVVVKDNSRNDKIFYADGSTEGCYSEVLADRVFTNIQDLLYDNGRAVIYVYDAGAQTIFQLDPENGETTSLFELNEGGFSRTYLAQDGDMLYLADVSSSKLHSLNLENNTRTEVLVEQDKTIVSGLAIDPSKSIAYVFYTPTSTARSLEDDYVFQVFRKMDLSSNRFVDAIPERLRRVNSQSQVANAILVGDDSQRIMAVDTSTNNLVNIPLRGGEHDNIIQGSFFIDFQIRHLALDEETNAIYMSLEPVIDKAREALKYLPDIFTTGKIVKYLPGQGVGYTVFWDFSFDIQGLAFDAERENLAFVDDSNKLLYHDPKKYSSAHPIAELDRRFIFAIYQGAGGTSYLLLNDYDADTAKLVKIENGEEQTLASLGRIGIFTPYENFVVDDRGEFAYLLETRGGGTKINKIDLASGESASIYENVDVFSTKIKWGLNQDTLILLSHDDKRQASLTSIALADASAKDIMNPESGEGPVVGYVRDFVVHRKAEVIYLMSTRHLYAVDMRTGNRSLLINASPGNGVSLQ